MFTSLTGLESHGRRESHSPLGSLQITDSDWRKLLYHADPQLPAWRSRELNRTLYGRLSDEVRRARTLRRPLVIAHLSLSADGFVGDLAPGRLCVSSIEDRIHIHRLRALVDASVLGARSALIDHPRLDVAFVEGDAPARVLLGGSTEVCDAWRLSERRPTLHIRPHSWGEDSLEGAISELADMSLHAVFVEGGPTTVRGFLQAGLVDVLQLHQSHVRLGHGVRHGLPFRSGRAMFGLSWQGTSPQGRGRLLQWSRLNSLLENL